MQQYVFLVTLHARETQAYPYQNLRYVETAELDEATTGKIVSVKS
jgi:hypothetical protein